MLPRWLASLTGRHDPFERVAASLYGLAVAKAREPAFYLDYRVPDTVDGRFDAIALHVWLILRVLRNKDEKAGQAAQALFDVFMADMDRSLREMGAGDLGVGKRVKAMAQALMGRAKAYDDGLAAADPQILNEAIRRNLLRGVDEATVSSKAPILADYVRRLAKAIEGQPLASLLDGQVDFAANFEARTSA